SSAAELHLEYSVAADGEGGQTRVRGTHGEATYTWRRIGPDRVARLVAGTGVACGHCPPLGQWQWDARGLLVGAGRLRYRHDEPGRLVAIEPAAATVADGVGVAIETRRFRDSGMPGAGMPE